jgi:hypothetical protein
MPSAAIRDEILDRLAYDERRDEGSPAEARRRRPGWDGAV